MNPFTLRGKISLPDFLITIADKITGLKALSDKYEDVRDISDLKEFTAASLKKVAVKYICRNNLQERIPKEGGAIIVANHPYGAVEGIVLLDALKSIRPDVKFMANYLLDVLPKAKEFCIYVDPFGRPDSAKRNFNGLRESIKWVKNGGLLVVFPGGTVSHYSFAKKEIVDPEWSSTVSRIVLKSESPVIPVFFEGVNPWYFQLAGLIHPILRTILLPRMLLNKEGKEVTFSAGNTIKPARLAQFESDAELIAYLRLRTYILGNRISSTTAPIEPHLNLKHDKIIDAVDPALLDLDFKSLPAVQTLMSKSNLKVVFAKARQIPNILREIGRLREVTFRAVNEGTGKSIDLDKFDRYYLHLFIWDEVNKQVLGAYRIGRADAILKCYGIEGLYTHTLFDYGPKLLNQIGPALELGRSFVRLEQQKNYLPLLLLWQGIGAFAVRYPRYRNFFGPVSINSEYDSISRHLIATFLSESGVDGEFEGLIKPRNPLKKYPVQGIDFQTTSYCAPDLKMISELLHEIEAKQREVPILLKQYMKLGGKLLAFNVDPDFGDVLDGLILVDLYEADDKLIGKYLGDEGSKSFVAFHDKKTKKQK